MSNGAEVKEGEVTNEAPVDAKAVEEVIPQIGIIQGTVTVTLNPDGGLSVNAPGNRLLALAIIKAGEVFLTMQMQNQMRQAAAMQPPRIVRPGSDALSKLTGRPS